MTRGRGIIFVKNLNNEIEAYESTEYNGDMFPEEEANRAEYFDKLKKANNLKDFIEMNKDFYLKTLNTVKSFSEKENENERG